MTQTIKKLSLTSIAFAIAIGGYFTASIPQAHALTSLAQVQGGDLIKGQSLPAVYFMGADGYRYVFPNDKTYFTWYKDFSTVKTISDVDLTKLQIGGNVTYRPGVKLVKIQSDPKTYAIGEGGALRWVTSESVAISMYGANWNRMIDDVPDGFFPNYKAGSAITVASDYVTADVLAGTSSINDDKNLIAPASMSITDSAFSPIDATVKVNQGVRFTNTGSKDHNATGDNLSWGTGTMKPGASKIIRFSKPGTYTFFDGLDSQHTGAIYVQ